MDLKDIFQWAPQLVSRFASVFVDSLSRPGLYFPPIGASRQGLDTVNGKAQQRWGLDPELITFAIGCIVVGAVLNEIMRASAYSAGDDPILLAVEKRGLVGLSTVITVVLLFWFAFSLLTFVFCRLLGGRGTWLETVSLSLQYFAINNVLANFLALLWVMLSPSPSSGCGDGLTIASLWYWITAFPDRIYFVFQFALLSIYVTKAIGTIHGFRFAKQSVIGILTASMTVTIAYLFYERIAPIHMG